MDEVVLFLIRRASSGGSIDAKAFESDPTAAAYGQGAGALVNVTLPFGGISNEMFGLDPAERVCRPAATGRESAPGS